MKKKLLLPVLLFTALFLFACAKQDTEDQPAVTAPVEDSALESPSTEAPAADISSDDDPPSAPDSGQGDLNAYDSASDSINALGYDLFAKMVFEEGNTCISPYSIELALGMAAGGASGNTRDEMLRVMHVKDLDAFSQEAKTSREKLENDAMDIRIANSVWFDKNITFSDSFESSYLPLLNDSYAAETFESDFGDASTLSDMNDWIARATNDKINDIISEIPQDTILILLNAVYFDAQWEVPFPKEGTYDEVFHSPSGDQTVPFMHLSDGFFQYVEYKGIKALRMNYKDSDMAMDILIPADREQSITELFNALSFEEKRELYQSLSDSEEISITSLKLPRFEFSSESVSLNDHLKELGMTEAFSPDADLSLISEGAFISQVNHKTFIRVDENGTEAAAVTSVMVDKMALIEGDLILFEADVPFMYLISDTSDGTTLFMGNMNSIN